MPHDIIKENFHRTKRTLRIKKTQNTGKKQQQLLIEEFEDIS